MSINPLAVLALFAGLLCANLAVTTWRQKGSSNDWLTFILLLAMAIYAGGYGFELASTQLSTALFWIRVEYCGIVLLPGVWLLIVLHLTNSQQHITPRFLALLFTIPLITLLLNHTNDLHHLYYRTAHLQTVHSFPVLAFTTGPGYWLFSTYMLVTFGTGLVLLVRALPHLAPLYKRQAIIMLVGTALPLTAYGVYRIWLSDFIHVDIVPFVFVTTGLIFTWSLQRYGLLDLVPASREKLIENLRAGVITLDAQGRLLYFNRTFAKMVGLSSAVLEMPLKEALRCASHPHLACVLSEYLIPDQEMDLEICTGEQEPAYLSIRSTCFQRMGMDPAGCVFTILDISSQKKAEIALQALTNELEDRVAERTQRLEKTVQRLEAEIAARQKVEAELREMKDRLSERVADSSRKLTALYDVISIGDQSLDMPDLLSGSFQKILAVLKSQASCLYLKEAATTTWNLYASVGLSPAVEASFASMPHPWFDQQDVALCVSNMAEREGLPDELLLGGMQAVQVAPVRMQNHQKGLLIMWWNAVQPFSVDDISMFTALADQMGILIENMALRHQIETEAVQQERRRLARDLHDSVTQSLHSLIFHTDTALNRLQKGKIDLVEKSLLSIRESAQQSLKEMRLLLYELRLKPLQDVDLIEALKIRLDAVEKRAGIHVQLTLDQEGVWPQEWESDLYRIAIEALNNSLKHAHASQLFVYLNGAHDWFDMKIVDNGEGFDSHSESSGLGLTTMAERAERLGGQLHIETSPSAGTCIHVRIGAVPERILN